MEFGWEWRLDGDVGRGLEDLWRVEEQKVHFGLEEEQGS